MELSRNFYKDVFKTDRQNITQQQKQQYRTQQEQSDKKKPHNLKMIRFRPHQK